MRTYSWKDRIGIRYMVFANSEKEAKDFLRHHYVKEDLYNLLFGRPCKITPRPKGCVEMSPMNIIWLPKNRKVKTRI